MRVGIVSQFGYWNIGNKLQNYALQQVLLEYADEVVTIKNSSKARNFVEYLRQFTFLAHCLFFNKFFAKPRKTEILKFHRKYIRDSQKYYCFEKDYASLRRQDRCNIYCAGSDQNWNPDSGYTGTFPYLGFAAPDVTFSYAASFGVDTIPAQCREDVRRGLQHIRHISVREDSGKRIVEDLTGRTDVQVLVDPTMLLTREEWDKVASKPPKALPERYILTYFLGEVSREREAAVREKAKALSCQVIELMDPNSPFYAIGPGEFIDLIKHAALVCTDSFHASVFSFLYQRPLAIFKREGSGSNMGSRLQTLATKFHLESNLVKENQIPELPETPDYRAGYEALEAERGKSKAFLDMVFRDAERNKL